MPAGAFEIGNVAFEVGRGNDLDSGGGQGGQLEQVILDGEREEEGSRGEHNVYVGTVLGPESGPGVVVGELGDGDGKGGVVGGGDHEVVGDAGGGGGLEDGNVLGGVVFDDVHGKGLVAVGVHVEVDAAKLVEDKVANGIGALDGEGVVDPGVDEPGVFFGEEFFGALVGPELG